MTDKLPSLPSVNSRTKTLIAGGVLGLLIGLLAARLYWRAAEENQAIDAGKISTMDALRLAVALLAIVRQVTDLGTGGKK